MNTTYQNRLHAFMAGYRGQTLSEAFMVSGIHEVSAYNDGVYARTHGKDVGFFERQQESQYGRYWEDQS